MSSLLPDAERCYRAIESRDRRFDGWFLVGVTSTGIYCRPSCPTPVRPKRENCTFHPSAASAERAGFRACKRCAPDAVPGSPEWNIRADLAARALGLIADGLVDREGVGGLARRLAVSERHLHRVLMAELGAPALALARSQRARMSRILLETTTLPITEVAFAAGFSSLRQFNDTVRAVFDRTPTELRQARSRRPAPVEGGAISLRLPHRSPIDHEHTLRWIAAHAHPGVTHVDGDTIERSLNLAGGPARIRLHLGHDEVRAHIWLTELTDLGAAVQRSRRLLDLDADPLAVAEVLDTSPLAPLVAQRPGLRVPGAADPIEGALGAVLGQQVSVAAAATFAGRLVRLCSVHLDDDSPLTHLPLTAEAVAGADLGSIGLTSARARTLAALAQAMADGHLALGPGADRHETRRRLLALPGIGPWTADVIAMSCLADPDVWPTGDLILRRRAAEHGLPDDPSALAQCARSWSPFRSYAAHQLWARHHTTQETP